MELIVFYKKRLSELTQHTNPTDLMKRVINTLQNPTEIVSIYDINQYYATLFLSDELCTVYFYPDFTCSLLKPPKNSIPHWSKYIDYIDTKPTTDMDIEWLNQILQQEPVNDKEILENYINGVPFYEPNCEYERKEQPSPDFGPELGLDYNEFDFTFDIQSKLQPPPQPQPKPQPKPTLIHKQKLTKKSKNVNQLPKWK